MKCIFGSENVSKPFRRAVIALGNFDGVHLGHQRLLKKAQKLAAKYKGISIVYTFEPHPVKILAPQVAPPTIQTLNQKIKCIEETGIDVCIIEKFTKKFAHQNPERFFESIILRRLGGSAVVVGYDFTFGFHRSGTVEILEYLGMRNKIEIYVMDAQFLNETLLSSTEIRGLVLAGFVDKAATLLGRPYELEGKVVKGKGLGGALGAHTANIEQENELIPGSGIYLTQTKIIDGAAHFQPSITSIGTNPTFPGCALAVETHIIDFKKEIFGKKVAVKFLKKMRNQIAFPSTAELKKQISKDIAQARRMHEEKEAKKQKSKEAKKDAEIRI
jgi:riboflavin kinase/FMN adenylyltransferase